MRRLGALLAAILLGSILLSLSVLLTLQMKQGDNLLGIALGVVGIAASVAAMLWIGLLEGIFAGLDTKKFSQALIILGAASPLMGASSFAADGRMGQAFLVAGVLAFAWCTSRLLGAFRGPPPPEHLPRELVHEYRGLFKAPRLRGSIGGHPVMVEYSNAWNGDRFESRRVEVFLPDGGRELTMLPASFIGRTISGSVQKTGDDSFDEHVHVRGLRLLVLTLLRAPAREAVRDLVRGGGTISDGAARSDARVPLPTLVKAASALSMTGSIFETLAANAFADPDAGVRLSTIELLLSLDGSEAREAALTACRKALDDADPRLQVFGIAVVLASGTEPAAWIARDRLAALRAGPVVGELLDRQEDGPACGALLRLLEDPHTGADAAPAVERFARRTKDEPLRDLANRTLERLRERAAEGRGQLSLTAPDAAGALSAGDDGGSVSLAPKKQPT